MLQTHFKLAGPKKKNSKKNSKKKTCRTDPIEARDFIWLSGEGGDEGDLACENMSNGNVISARNT